MIIVDIKIGFSDEKPLKKTLLQIKENYIKFRGLYDYKKGYCIMFNFFFIFTISYNLR